MVRRSDMLELREEVKAALSEKGIKYCSEKVKADGLIGVITASHELFVQGPWNDLGSILEAAFQKAINYDLWSDDDVGFRRPSQYTETPLEEICDVAGNLCKGFFRNFEADVHERMYDYYFHLKCKLLEEEN